MNNVVSGASTPYFDTDVFCYMATQFVGLNDLRHLASVCKAWNEFVQTPALWKQLFTREGLLEVEGGLKLEEYPKAFQVLYAACPVTPKIIAKVLGEVEPLPPIRREIYEKLLQSKEPHELVPEFPYILRVLDKDTPLALDDDGNLFDVDYSQETEADASEDEDANMPTFICLNSHNIVQLSRFPLFKHENITSVFLQRFNAVNLKDQCNFCAVDAGIYLCTQRISLPKKIDGYSYEDVETLIADKGQLMPFCPLLLQTVIKLLHSGSYESCFAGCDILCDKAI